MIKNMQEKINNSNFKVTKNFKYFIIAPLLFLIVGIILMCTIGFNLGADYSNGTTFRVYSNYENVIEDAESYDLNNDSDYSEVYNKIQSVLNEHNAKLVSYRTTSMNIYDYSIFGGQAVEVVYQGKASEREEVRNDILAEFNYASFDNAVSSFDEVVTQYSFDYVIGIVCAIVFSLLAVAIYMALRYNPSALFVSLLTVATDLFLTISLVLITRLTVNLTFGVVILITLILSVINLMAQYMSVKSGVKQGKYEKMRESEIASSLSKETILKRCAIYFGFAIIAIILAVMPIIALREVALGVLIALVVSFYTSQFLLPSYWATFTRNKKKKNLYKKEQKDMSN